jgi:hypothetical protein
MDYVDRRNLTPTGTRTRTHRPSSTYRLRYPGSLSEVGEFVKISVPLGELRYIYIYISVDKENATVIDTAVDRVSGRTLEVCFPIVQNYHIESCQFIISHGRAHHVHLILRNPSQVREKNSPATVNVLKTIIIVVWMLVVMAVAVGSCGFNAV